MFNSEDDFIMATGGEGDICEGCRHLFTQCTCGPDYEFRSHGSVWLCSPQSLEAERWLHAHAPVGSQWFQRALLVEPRYVMALAEQLEVDGYTTEL